MREKEERRQKWIENFVARRQAKFAKEEAKEEAKRVRKAMKKELAEAKKVNKQMDLDIQEQIVEDIAKLTLDITKLSDEEYFKILMLKQNMDQVLTWDE